MVNKPVRQAVLFLLPRRKEEENSTTNKNIKFLLVCNLQIRKGKDMGAKNEQRDKQCIQSQFVFVDMYVHNYFPILMLSMIYT